MLIFMLLIPFCWRERSHRRVSHVTEQVKVEHINFDFFVGLRWKVLGGVEIKLRKMYLQHIFQTLFLRKQQQTDLLVARQKYITRTGSRRIFKSVYDAGRVLRKEKKKYQKLLLSWRVQ